MTNNNANTHDGMTAIRARTAEQVAAVAQELQRQKETRLDVVVPAKQLYMSTAQVSPDGELSRRPQLSFEYEGHGRVFEISQVAHQQMAERLGITPTYYRKMQIEAPGLLAINVNHWLDKNEKNWLIRTLDGRVRAALSDSYRILDTSDLFFHAFQKIQEMGASIVDVSLTEERFYLRAVDRNKEQKITMQQQMMQEAGVHHTPGYRAPGPQGYGNETPEPMQERQLIPGIVITTSDVGRGGLKVEPYMLDLVCLNGMVGTTRLTQVHLGSKQEIGWVSHETREKQDVAFWGTVTDMIYNTFDEESFKARVREFEGLSAIKLEHPVKAVEHFVKNNLLTAIQQTSIIEQLIRGGDHSMFGFISAVTATARDTFDPEDQIALERLAGKIVEDNKAVMELARVS